MLSFSQPCPRELGVAQTTRQRGDEETGQSCPEMGGTLGEEPGGAHPVQFTPNFWGELFTPQRYCPADWGRCCGTVSLWGLWMQGQDFFLPDSHLC